MTKSIDQITATRQIAFHQLLVSARNKWLNDALAKALKEADPDLLKKQVGQLVPVDAQRVLAAAGIRDEYVFPTPHLLETAPNLVGYYRLLLGLPQKTFYSTGSGMGKFKSMEQAGTLNQSQKKALLVFCKRMCKTLTELVVQVSPTITPRDVSELPLLTLGSQFQGGNNNTIGKQVTKDIFLLVSEILEGNIIARTETSITAKNNKGSKFLVKLASDPDLVIQEISSGKPVLRAAIEIKGGTDRSNAHNRAGEAEKSHQKARNSGYQQCWTIISLKSLNLSVLRSESPTTGEWFDVAHLLTRKGKYFDLFVEKFLREVGI